MEPDLFYPCRVLAAKHKSDAYVVLQGSEVPRRLDVEADLDGFSTKEEAVARIHAKEGAIANGPELFLDFFYDERLDTVWCWKDERTWGVSQIFKTKRQALSALSGGRLIFTVMTD